MRPTERPRQNAGPRADARGTRPMDVTRSTRLIQNAERSSVYSVWRLKAAFQCVLWLKSRGMKNGAEVGGFCVFWKEKRES